MSDLSGSVAFLAQSHGVAKVGLRHPSVSFMHCSVERRPLWIDVMVGRGFSCVWMPQSRSETRCDSMERKKKQGSVVIHET